MNKAVLKNFAGAARNELLERVRQKAFEIGITEDKVKKATLESSDAVYINGRQLDRAAKTQRESLIAQIKSKGYSQVMEEVSYTWFNRFCALRFMEVNDYLPTKVRVLSSTSGSFEPDIIKEALSIDLNVEKEKVFELKEKSDTHGLFKYLVIKQCNALSEPLPFMFEKIEDYTEILFPDNLLKEGTFLRVMVEEIPEEDWKQVEIIGWLYQYYISEKKDEVFADLKKNIKITKENIPAATQLFTPHWIVRYMVENSLGRIWIESYPETPLKADWKYYLDEAEQEEAVKKQLEEIRYKNVNPEEVTFLDPCCGSGHILVYAFEVFYAMYLEKGYVESDIPKLILEKNLFGLDIDDRAAQLAAFAVMMKARERSRRVFRQNIRLNICAVQESNWLSESAFSGIKDFQELLIDIKATELEKQQQRATVEYLAEVFSDAKEYGSILDVKAIDLKFLENRLNQLATEPGDMFEMLAKKEILEKLPGLILQAKIMGRKYDVVCTNPPYMSSSGMGVKLTDYVKRVYSDSKSDLFAVFIEKCSMLIKLNGLQAMITQHSWMFLSSFEKLREKLLIKDTINMAHLGARAFEEIGGEVVQTTSWILRNSNTKDYKALYLRLVNLNSQDAKEATFLTGQNRYLAQKGNFTKIPGMPIAYWASDKIQMIFKNSKELQNYGKPRQGMATSNNNSFLRLWYEINNKKFKIGVKDSKESVESRCKWFPYNKGGSYRKWFGNNEYVVNWENDGYDIKKEKSDNLQKGLIEKKNSKCWNSEFYFMESISWSKVSTGNFSIRYIPCGYIFDVAGCSIFTEKDYMIALLGFLNSTVMKTIISLISPTINYEVGQINILPVLSKIFEHIYLKNLATQNIEISRTDWDSYETSWDYKLHPLLTHKGESKTIESAFANWSAFAEKQFYQLKSNEEELNRIFIDIYGLQDELTPEVEEKDVTVRKADQLRDIKSFISYAVGCMIGRYSLDKEGLVFAGGEFDNSNYPSFPADNDNVIPILTDEYFKDDIVTRFVDFVKVTFGTETIEQNLDFIADTLGRKGSETSKDTIRRYFVNDFYKDHVQIYKKRPIYWMFSSGKEKAFNCLVYLHRYNQDTASTIRTDYLHRLQETIEVEKRELVRLISQEAGTKEGRAAAKKLESLEKQVKELHSFEEKVHHYADLRLSLDLDDGVKVNYQKLGELLIDIGLKKDKGE